MQAVLSKHGTMSRRFVSRRLSHAGILALLAVVAIVVFLLCAILIEGSTIDNPDGLVLVSFLFNMILGSVFLAREIERRPFSINQIHWIFYITFFVIAPTSQYLFGFSCWGYALNANDYVETNLMVLAWGVIVAVLSMVRTTERLSYGDYYDRFYTGLPKMSAMAAYLMLIISVIASFFVVRQVGFQNLFSRTTFSTGLGSTLGALFDKGVRQFPVFAFVFILVYYRQSRKGRLLLVLSFALVLISVFPLVLSRYSLAVIYGGIGLLLLRPFSEKRGLFPLVFLLLLLLVFPVMATFRILSFSTSRFFTRLGEVFLSLPRGFCSSDFDAYSMLARARFFVRDHGATNGRQLLTTLLFFVPRSVWPSKAVGSGAMIGSTQGQSFLNISCPLPAEGLVNFGFIGFVAFACVTGILINKIDTLFYEGTGGLRVFYPFAMMFFFFILRGDLLSSWAYTCGYLAVFLTMLGICLACSPNHSNKTERINVL